MNWLQLLSLDTPDVQQNLTRTVFDRDFDRIIFSHPFRKLQDKTQVHPLPEQDFVHTRLTHSLEVSSVGRSLGRLVGSKLIEKYDFLQFKVTAHDFGAIVAAASLAHDIGNPPFGHSGESSISDYFKNAEAELKPEVSESEWSDLINFEGNAQGFRLLNRPGYQGLKLSSATLAAFTKYPRPALVEKQDRARRSQKKFGFYDTERSIFQELGKELGLETLGTDQYCRHPLAFLVEAADDICYHIIDLEDGCNLGLVTYEQTVELLANVIGDKFQPEKLEAIHSLKERIGVLRAMAIGQLIQECGDLFMEHEEKLLTAEFDISLADEIPSKDAMAEIISVSVEKIYRSRDVVETEAAGYRVLNGLLEVLVPATLAGFKKNLSAKDKTYFRLLPTETQAEVKEANSAYLALRAALDYVAGMTDSNALNLYRKIMGISLPGR
ncbi:deoxyguanosinetriphosphate triphosphohydrolase [Roseivirga sp.]|uniref:deoxyguanosinetriphosphate triphosphohydrolase n=1 Tax=Roseivirga sp. TaxID=1964215 RepID=UPI002B278961|nr:deoxyguanosinetriphosphate triphosphohydrolase [Roseivirga sp.]